MSGLSVNADGHVHLGGKYGVDMTWGDVTLEQSEGFLAELDAVGEPVGARALRGLVPRAVEALAGGDLLVAGLVSGAELDIGDGPTGLWSGFALARLDGSGNTEWLVTSSAAGAERVTVGADGAIYIDVTSQGQLTIGGTTHAVDSAPSVAAFTPAGEVSWIEPFVEGGSNGWVFGLATAPGGDLVMLGAMQGYVMVEDEQVYLDSAGYMRRVDSSGQTVWSRVFGEEGATTYFGGTHLDVGAGGEIVIGGASNVATDLGAGPIQSETGGGSHDVWMAGFGP